MAVGSLNPLVRHIRSISAAFRDDEESDAQLLDRFVRLGDEHAFTILVKRHGPMVRDVCRRLPAGTALTDVVHAVRADKLTYPNLLAADKSSGLIAGYPVKLFPYCILVDAHGQVQAQGSLRDMLQKYPLIPTQNKPSK
jgi:hypothetical protein